MISIRDAMKRKISTEYFKEEEYTLNNEQDDQLYDDLENDCSYGEQFQPIQTIYPGRLYCIPRHVNINEYSTYLNIDDRNIIRQLNSLRYAKYYRTLLFESPTIIKILDIPLVDFENMERELNKYNLVLVYDDYTSRYIIKKKQWR